VELVGGNATNSVRYARQHQNCLPDVWYQSISHACERLAQVTWARSKPATSRSRVRRSNRQWTTEPQWQAVADTCWAY